MISTPWANRWHIGIFGKCNSGKSSLINAITGQQTAIVSEVAGTTTDLVIKAMEIAGIGPCLLMDTAGFDDSGPLGGERLTKTMQALEKSDIALMMCIGMDIEEEIRWTEKLRARHVPVIPIINRNSKSIGLAELEEEINRRMGSKAVVLNADTGEGVEILLSVLAEHKKIGETPSITGNLAHSGDTVLMVMPQDRQAPAGRLILPQVQTLRELLDKRCTVVCCQPDDMEKTLATLNTDPALIIADSQVAEKACALARETSAVTTFSILYASYKGNPERFAEGARAISRLTGNARVLIAEACTHAPQEEDIGRVKIPRMLRERVGDGLRVDIVGGTDFPECLAPYELIIHCGACMFNRQYMLSRMESAAAQHVPITNYGMAIAYLKGILDKMSYPLKPASDN